MGRNNRQRRAAKARKQARSHRRSTRHHGLPPGGAPFTALDRFGALVLAHRMGDTVTVGRLLDLLELDPTIDAEAAGVVQRRLAELWDRGWQPADVHRTVGRSLGRTEVALLVTAVAAQSASYADLGRAVAPAWMDQLATIGAGEVRPIPRLDDLGLPRRGGLEAAARLTNLLLRLPALPLLGPPPSAWRRGSVLSDPSLPGSLLARVRALLAKAESTSFEAEAEAFTAKAQELMTRHRIDQAALEAQGGAGRGEPVGRRLAVDDPYAEAKASLLDAIARTNGCRAAWSKDLGFSTVFGYPDQLSGVDELFTSLLVQATAALQRAGSRQDRFGRSRTTRFRRSFLVAFAVRIGHRLEAAVEGTLAEGGVGKGSALLPVLAAHDARVTAAFEATFPDLVRSSAAASDDEGWWAGTLFGDEADLSLGPALEAQPA